TVVIASGEAGFAAHGPRSHSSRSPHVDLDALLDRTPADLRPGDGQRSLRRPCAIVYTSGSTGTPKGALLHEHGAVRSARLSWQCWYGGIEPLRTVVQHPINHVGWLVCECVAALVAGGSLYFRERFDGGATLRLIEEHALN